MDSTVRGHQPAGPNRWKRAEQWAAENPHTAQGKKYLARRDAASQVASQGPDRAWEHWTRDWSGGETYKGQTCSTEHAMLKLQLDLGIAGLEPLYEAVQEENPRAFVRMKETPKRKGKCQVCGGEVVVKT
jgi:hypothetical protein